jgi:NitT/TauT family transport system ATP-binding protein
MKQRAGIARALAVYPEMLFLDEPFSQVDALTAESLRAEIIDIWTARKRALSSVLMVSHDIKEVVFMADRIVILGANPGRVLTVVANTLPRPRDYRAAEFLQLVDHLHDLITGQELPDVAPSRPGVTVFEPLPDAHVNEIIGLLEYLDARGGREEIFRIAADTNTPFGPMLEIVEAAELLDFVDTPKRLVVLDTEGRRFLAAQGEERLKLWREQLMRLGLFRAVFEALRQQKGKGVDREFVLELLVLHMPHENSEQVFRTFRGWARFCNLFTFHKRTEKITLPEKDAE